MSSKSRSKRRRGRLGSVQKPGGTFHPRVQAVGPERFGIVGVDVGIPSGIVVRIGNERSQAANRTVARAILEVKLRQRAEKAATINQNGKRKKQVGESDRAGKIRTVQEQNGKVVNHGNGRRCSVKENLRGRLDLIQ